ncbi:hypothetical protein C8J57DRAFT_1251315 [Mycena rebaudengoi]|nr:hypothetical protein C8J57DRAFT_1251315 [Mycena rebaudengoi]
MHALPYHASALGIPCSCPASTPAILSCLPTDIPTYGLHRELLQHTGDMLVPPLIPALPAVAQGGVGSVASGWGLWDVIGGIAGRQVMSHETACHELDVVSQAGRDGAFQTWSLGSVNCDMEPGLGELRCVHMLGSGGACSEQGSVGLGTGVWAALVCTWSMASWVRETPWLKLDVVSGVLDVAQGGVGPSSM